MPFHTRWIHHAATAAFFLVAAFFSSGVQAAFPERSVRIVVPFPPGGAVDSVARIVAGHLSQAWGTPVVVDNKAGAGGAIGVDAVAKAPKTGYELLLAPIGPMTINPSLYPRLPYDTVRDFEAIVLIAGTPSVLVVQPRLGVESAQQFVSLLKAKPGELNYGSAGSGNLTHLAAEYFLSQTQTRAVHVPYKGSAPAITDFLGGQLDFMFDVVPTALPHIQAGKFKPLAVTSLKRSPALPDVPTLAELGWRSFDVTSWWGLMAPKGVPSDVIRGINAEVNRGLQLPATRDALVKLGANPLGGTPEEFGAHVQAELRRWHEVVVRSGTKVE